ncbi:hypothetical protein [Kluyvera ascorbata]|uniref:hypothetical protein n=1 Tax=Kluyvera ascorbata TaxID=51288 RepID=UPI00356AC4A3
MPNDGNISTGVTQKTNDCSVQNICHVAISRPVRYDVMIAYGGHGGAEMLKAAEFKKKRLEAKYPNGVVIGPKIFKSLDEFEKIWTDIFYDVCKLNKSGLPTYDLCEIHIFAHSNPDRISIKKGEHITSEIVESLENFIWNPENGYLVLHSCRSGRYESDDIDQRSGGECIARAFSRHEPSAYVIGQMVYASFNYGLDLEDYKYRTSINDYIAIDWLNKQEILLWGYKSGSKVEKRYSNDPGYKNLADGQIWPCRKFRNGEALSRAVTRNGFNYDDLNFI